MTSKTSGGIGPAMLQLEPRNTRVKPAMFVQLVGLSIWPLATRFQGLPEESLTPVAARISSTDSDKLVAPCTVKAILVPLTEALRVPAAVLSVATCDPSVSVRL